MFREMLEEVLDESREAANHNRGLKGAQLKNQERREKEKNATATHKAYAKLFGVDDKGRAYTGFPGSAGGKGKMTERVRERKMKHVSDNLYFYIPEIIMQAEIYDDDPSLTYDQIVKAVADVNPRKSAQDVWKGLQWLVKNKKGIIKTHRGGTDVYSFDSDYYEYDD